MRIIHKFVKGATFALIPKIQDTSHYGVYKCGGVLLGMCRHFGALAITVWQTTLYRDMLDLSTGIVTCLIQVSLENWPRQVRAESGAFPKTLLAIWASKLKSTQMHIRAINTPKRQDSLDTWFLPG